MEGGEPGLVVKEPSDGESEALVEGGARPPAELVGDLGRVNGITEVVARPVSDESDEVVVDPVNGDGAVRAKVLTSKGAPVGGELGQEFTGEVDGAADDVNIGTLVVSTDIVACAVGSTVQDEVNSTAVVVDEKPVADIRAVTVDRERLAGEDVGDGERDELLGEMEGAVIIRTAGDGSGQAVGVAVGVDKEISSGLGSRIR